MTKEWYVYENDVYGVSGLLSFDSREDLSSYMTSDEFFEFRFSEDPSEALRASVRDLSERFATMKIDAPALCDALTTLFGEHESEIDSIEIEDFAGLCAGKSGFSEAAIEIFCDIEEIELLTEIPDRLKPAFREFLDHGQEEWIG